jgi:hypothetical protein
LQYVAADAATPSRCEAATVTFHDLRGAPQPASLAANGFELFEHRTAVADFADPEQIEKTYLREVEDLVRSVTGARDVFAYPLSVQRSTDHGRVYKDIISDVIAPMVHIDATPRSIDMLAAAALARAGRTRSPGGRVAYFTVWRCLSPPPQAHPLAVCDLHSVDPEDLVPADALGVPGSVDPRIEYYLVRANARHRWCYYSDMTRDEVLLFQQYDSGRPGPSGCPHASFAHPRHASAPPRRSIEARACAFLG